MPRALIAGCGYIGEPLADSLQADGWEVEAWTASVESAARLRQKCYPVIARDISHELPAGRRIDVVVHCASAGASDAAAYERVYLRGAANLVAAFPGVALLFTSSTAVYGQTNDEVVAENSPAKPTRATARVLMQAERVVLGSGGVVARLAGIYGPSRSALLDRFLRGDPIARAADDYFVNQVHRDDIVSALRLLINRRAELRGHVVNVVDDAPMRSRECYRVMSDVLERAMPPTADTAPARRRSAGSKRVSNAKLRQLGWVPRFPTYESGLRATVVTES